MVGPRFVYPSVCGWTLGLLTVVNNAAMPTVSLLKEPPGTGGWMGEEGQVACVILSPPLVVSGWVHIQRPAFHSRVVQAPPPPPRLAHRSLVTSCVVGSLPWDGGGLSGCLHLSQAQSLSSWLRTVLASLILDDG